ncbi:hypothetical protein PF010_g15949 [Phytophthora fragariae]|uniref:Uncharacterized protein n=1 Tax=Phytophthora fragariae TaxID=53985 RepID=A0A6G0KSQ1_9STRA|nr:hypothetical protein PF010_g15949 [Phytophthora fragariae]
MSQEPPTKKRKVVDAPEAVEAASEQITKLTEELPSLPFAYQYRGGKFFYVRKCYERYYELVKKMLDGGKPWVTVTGTPGIGKSVFYAYFFNRLREREPNTWIIAISFWMEAIKEIIVYKGRGDPGTIERKKNAIDMVLEEAHANKKKLIFLCDGPPTKLREATLALSLAGPSGVKCISDDDLETRFNTFGGVASECLSLDEVVVDLAKDYIIDEIKTINSLGKLRSVLKGVHDGVDWHCLFYYFPVDVNGMIRDWKLASPFVVERLAERMLQVTRNDKEAIRASIEDIPRGAPLAEWLDAHEGLGGAQSS